MMMWRGRYDEQQHPVDEQLHEFFWEEDVWSAAAAVAELYRTHYCCYMTTKTAQEFLFSRPFPPSNSPVEEGEEEEEEEEIAYSLSIGITTRRVVHYYRSDCVLCAVVV